MYIFRKLAILIIVGIAVSSMAFVMKPAQIMGANAQEDADNIIKNAIVLHVGSPVAYINDSKSQIDGDNQEVVPIIKEDVTLVPLRFVVEGLGATVTWDEKSKSAEINMNRIAIRINEGSKAMIAKDKIIRLEVPAQIIEERMFVPIRALAEALDKKVFYENRLIVISDKDLSSKLKNNQDVIDELVSRVNKLPSVNNYGNLKKLLEKYNQSNYTNEKYKIYNTVDMAGAPMALSKSEAARDLKALKDDFSTTNVQVQGVDEGDLIKNDGEYIYQVNNRAIAVIKAYPANDMKVLTRITFSDNTFNPRELYLDEKHLVVIGDSYFSEPVRRPMPNSNSKMMPDYGYYPQYYSRQKTKAIVYDIRDKSKIKETRSLEIDGSYLTSRKIDSNLYLISNQYVNYYTSEDEIVPMYRDSSVQKDSVKIDYSDIYYFPGQVRPNYMVIGGVNIEENDKMNVSAYLGAGQNVYASTENLYVALQKNNYRYYGVIEGKLSDPEVSNMENTDIYKFKINNGTIEYKGKGEVPGSILNQFSMDEYNNYFRVATTVGNVWDKGVYASRNNVYILDNNLYLKGKIEDIARGEKIYSVRFMGNRGYIVTFKKVDPLFVIDMNPQSPKILGALKIPGYSDYLHPYDENHIIGFGKDTIESSVKDVNGNNVASTAYYLGMKLAIFDVSDVSNPKEMFVEKIGDRGTDSELLRNHRALLFSKSRNLLAFPVNVMEVKDKSYMNQWGSPEYGTFAFQGAYVYNIDLTSGFKLKGRITHLDDQDYLKVGNYWSGSSRDVERIIYIKDTLYTLSKGMVKANNLGDLKEISKISIN